MACIVILAYWNRKLPAASVAASKSKPSDDDLLWTGRMKSWIIVTGSKPGAAVSKCGQLYLSDIQQIFTTFSIPCFTRGSRVTRHSEKFKRLIRGINSPRCYEEDKIKAVRLWRQKCWGGTRLGDTVMLGGKKCFTDRAACFGAPPNCHE